METTTLDVDVVNIDMLIDTPELIEEMYFEPLSENVFAKHALVKEPIFIGNVPKSFVSLFFKKLIRIKSWKVIPEQNKVLLSIILMEGEKL